MSRKDFKTELIATEEADLTGFKLSERRSSKCTDAYVFESKKNEGSAFYNIINSTKVFVRSGSVYPFVAPVINCKVNDLWDCNDGEPIHCTAIVYDVTTTDSGKTKITLQIHRISELQGLKVEEAKLVQEDVICRDSNEFIGRLEKMKRDNPKRYQWYINSHK